MKRAFLVTKFNPASLAIIHQANEICEEYEAEGFELTLRQLYYQFVSRALLENTVQSYKRLGSIINDGRMSGLIDWDHIIDRTRNLNTHNAWSDPGSIIEAVGQQYMEDLWQDQDNYVEVWVEKDALVGVIAAPCTTWRTPYFACRGYVSQSEMYQAAQRLKREVRRDRRVTILHLGDHDPSGVDMSRDIQDRLSLMSGYRINVKRIALNMHQIEEYGPPPNPAKATDARFENYEAEFGKSSWELDALEPRVITGLITKELEALIDMAKWEYNVENEKQSRNQLGKLARNWDDATTWLSGIDESEQK